MIVKNLRAMLFGPNKKHVALSLPWLASRLSRYVFLRSPGPAQAAMFFLRSRAWPASRYVVYLRWAGWALSRLVFLFGEGQGLAIKALCFFAIKALCFFAMARAWPSRRYVFSLSRRYGFPPKSRNNRFYKGFWHFPVISGPWPGRAASPGRREGGTPNPKAICFFSQGDLFFGPPGLPPGPIKPLCFF